MKKESKGGREKLKEILTTSLRITKNNFKSKNGNYFGVLFYLLEPLSFFLVLIFVIESLMKDSNPIYPIYLLIGLIIFNFFRQSTVQSINSIKVEGFKGPKESLIISKIFHSIFSHIFEIILLIGFLIFYNKSIIGLVFYPSIFIFLIFFVSGISFILATIGLFFNSTIRLWNIVTRTLWFLTPTFYFIEENSRLFLMNLFNPMFYFIDITRDIIIHNRIPKLWMVSTIILISLFVFVFGIFIFCKYKDKFEND